MKKFIKSNDGLWVNIEHIKSFYVGGSDECGYRICFSYDFHELNRNNPCISIKFMSFGETYFKKEECQEALDQKINEFNHW